MKKSVILILTTLLLLSVFSCKKSTKQQIDINSIDITITNGNADDFVTEPQRWHITNKRICVVFGYDFNSPEIVEEYTAILKKRYGLDSEDGLILPVIYPDDFKHGARSYSNDLLNILQNDDIDYAGVIILGAPEKTHLALAKNQDKWNQEVPYPVIALFPQDDVLGLESTCDIVIDKGQSVNEKEEEHPEELENVIIAEAPDVLCETIDYMLCLNYSLTKNIKIMKHVSQMLKGRNIQHYSDPETGLQAINHFILK